jgi:hypothetical protein
MASGRSTKLTGALGEYLVAAELSRRGLIAAPFAGNVPHLDILAATEQGEHLSVQVKTTNSSSWQFDIRGFLDVELTGRRQTPKRVKPEPVTGLVCALVMVAPRKADRFFLLSWLELRKLLASKYRSYLKKHHFERPRSPESFHTKADLRDVLAFENQWDDVLPRSQ